MKYWCLYIWLQFPFFISLHKDFLFLSLPSMRTHLRNITVFILTARFILYQFLHCKSEMLQSEQKMTSSVHSSPAIIGQNGNLKLQHRWLADVFSHKAVILLSKLMTFPSLFTITSSDDRLDSHISRWHLWTVSLHLFFAGYKLNSSTAVHFPFAEWILKTSRLFWKTSDINLSWLKLSSPQYCSASSSLKIHQCDSLNSNYSMSSNQLHRLKTLLWHPEGGIWSTYSICKATVKALPQADRQILPASGNDFRVRKLLRHISEFVKPLKWILLLFFFPYGLRFNVMVCYVLNWQVSFVL